MQDFVRACEKTTSTGSTGDTFLTFLSSLRDEVTGAPMPLTVQRGCGRWPLRLLSSFSASSILHQLARHL